MCAGGRSVVAVCNSSNRKRNKPLIFFFFFDSNACQRTRKRKTQFCNGFHDGRKECERWKKKADQGNGMSEDERPQRTWGGGKKM